MKNHDFQGFEIAQEPLVLQQWFTSVSLKGAVSSPEGGLGITLGIRVSITHNDDGCVWSFGRDMMGWQ